MANNVTLINGVQPTVTTIVNMFTSPTNGGGTRITAFTASNQAATTQTYSVYLVPSGGSADDTNRIIIDSSLSPTGSSCDNYVSEPEVLIHFLPAGATLHVKVSTGTTISFRASGINY